MGHPDKLDLQVALESGGWHVERQTGDEWWEREVWTLTSTRRPVHAKALLLVDPMSHTGGVESVWAVAATTEKPFSREQAGDFAIRVRPRWPERMKEIVKAVELLRPAS